jgi:hypothetical protein
MYLSSIQQGIQAGHVISEMFNKYGPDLPAMALDVSFTVTEQFTRLNEWSRNHKTMILLNGGYGENLHELEGFFEGTLDQPGVTGLGEYDGYNPYPFAAFCESDEALDGAFTSFGCILPPKIYDGARLMQKVKRLPREIDARILFEHERILMFDAPDGRYEVQYTQWEIELMERLMSFRLAQ